MTLPVMSSSEEIAVCYLAKKCIAEDICRQIETNRNAANDHLNKICQMLEERGEILCLESYEYKEEVRWYHECLTEVHLWEELISKL